MMIAPTVMVGAFLRIMAPSNQGANHDHDQQLHDANVLAADMDAMVSAECGQNVGKTDRLWAGPSPVSCVPSEGRAGRQFRKRRAG